MDYPTGVESALDGDVIDYIPMANRSIEDRICNHNLTDDEIKHEIRSVNWNLGGVCFCLLLVTSATTALVNFGTPLLTDERLNTASLATIVVMEVVGSAMIIPYANKLFGSRRMAIVTLILIYFFHLTYFYPGWATTFPVSALLGLGQGCMAIMFMYGHSLTDRCCQLANQNYDVIMALVCGLITSSLGGGLLIGNAVLYLALDPTRGNSTVENKKCGTQYCPSDNSAKQFALSYDSWRYYAMVEVFATVAIAGVLLSLFLRDFVKTQGRRPFNFLEITKETWLSLKDNKAYLLVGIALFAGLEEGFLLFDYAKAYTSCGTWAPKAWLVMMMICGAAQMTSAATQWIIVKFLGRTLAISFSVIIFMGCFITLIVWHPKSSSTEVYISVAGLWGFAHGVLVSVIFSTCSLWYQGKVDGFLTVTFFWRCLGHLLSFVCSQILCTSAHLFILMAVGLIGFLKYLSLEQKLKMDRL